jgi:hypothetical protein
MVFAADVDLALGQLLYEEPTVKRGKSRNISNRNGNANSFKQGRTKFKTSFNINKKKRM